MNDGAVLRRPVCGLQRLRQELAFLLPLYQLRLEPVNLKLEVLDLGLLLPASSLELLLL